MAWLTVCSVATNAIRERNVNDNVCRRLYTMWLDGEYILEARRDWMAFVKRIHKSFELSFYWLHFSEPQRIIKMIFKTEDTFLINSDCMLLHLPNFNRRTPSWPEQTQRHGSVGLLPSTLRWTRFNMRKCSICSRTANCTEANQLRRIATCKCMASRGEPKCSQMLHVFVTFEVKEHNH